MKIAVVATNNCSVSAIYGVIDVFFAANYCMEQRYGKQSGKTLQCEIVTYNNKPCTGYNGVSIQPTVDIAQFVPDLIVVASSVELVILCCQEHMSIEGITELSTWLSKCESNGSIIASFCTGSFVLAQSGLLNGKVATTHWRSAELFKRAFPHIQLNSDELIVDNGNLVCSGGSMSYIDLSLYLIEREVSKEIASDTAKLLVFDPVREKQSQFTSFSAQKDHNDQAILSAQEWLESHFKEKIVIDDIAERVALTPRTFKRRFKQATQETPLSYLQRIRIEYAKGKLERSTQSINNIMWSSGYEDLSSFRQLFKRYTGLTPKEYRYKFA